uniref:Uncharacterized protein n=1 Tax=Zea mays TaxID=4577 RepID=A0A804QQY5_MAIZE
MSSRPPLWPSSRVSWKIRAAQSVGIQIRRPLPSTLVCRSLLELRLGASACCLLSPGCATTCSCCCSFYKCKLQYGGGIARPPGSTDLLYWDEAFYDNLHNRIGGGKPKMRWYFGENGWPSSKIFETPPSTDSDKEKLVDIVQIVG